VNLDLLNSTSWLGFRRKSHSNKIYIGVLERHKEDRNKKGGGYESRIPTNKEDWPSLVSDDTFNKTALLIADIELSHSRQGSHTIIR